VAYKGSVGRNTQLEVVASKELSDATKAELRTLLLDSFGGDFTDHDWQHGLGGMHVIALDDGRTVGHAAVVGRRLYVGDAVYDGGYLEAVAVHPQWRRRGIGAEVVRAANAVVIETYPIAALSTHMAAFYERLGWERWHGPAHVVRGGLWVRHPDEDDGVMVLRPPGGPPVDLTAKIAVDHRSGDDY
jgi:aminoglycoside 2'-N-acetyltransferase I